MAQFVYHAVPQTLKGNTLVPLKELERVFPEIHAKHEKKYDPRPNIQKIWIPKLNCYWGEVIHFFAVHPKKVKQALKNAGFKGPMLDNSLYQTDTFYRIDASKLKPSKTVVFLYLSEIFRISDTILNLLHLSKKFRLKSKEVIHYNPKTISNYNEFPEKTKEYYKECQKKGVMPLTFQFVPHVLYKGRIKFSRMSVIKI